MSRLLIQLNHLFKSLGSISLFEDVSLSIHEGEFLALVGENGAGKTTFLELLSGRKLADSGNIRKSPPLSIGFFEQESTLDDPLISVRSFIEGSFLCELEEKMSACLEDPSRLSEWEELHERYEQLGGYNRSPLEPVLIGLKIDSSWLDMPMKHLSSGQQARVCLAKALIENPDLLLLDEPTNHLDQEMIEWLQSVLEKRKGASVIVSHDRKFLNAACNRLIEIKNGKLNRFEGSYDFFLEEKKRLMCEQINAYIAQEEEKAQLKQKIKEMTFARKKQSPAKDRNIMAYDRRGENHQKSLQHKLDAMKGRLQEIESNLLVHPKPKSIVGLKFISNPLPTTVAIELEGVCKRYKDQLLFSNFSKTVYKKDRILITGPNGCGKTTLLEMIANLASLDSGKIRVSPTVKMAFLDQEVKLLPMNMTPLQYFESRFNLSYEDLRRELHKAALGGVELLDRSFSDMSIGQRKRMMLLAIIQEKPNTLLLDEPTNHLDLMTLEALEEALLHFEGAIIAVSHDMAFIDKIATNTWELTK